MHVDLIDEVDEAYLVLLHFTGVAVFHTWKAGPSTCNIPEECLYYYYPFFHAGPSPMSTIWHVLFPLPAL